MNRTEALALAKRVVSDPKKRGAKKLALWLLRYPHLLSDPPFEMRSFTMYQAFNLGRRCQVYLAMTSPVAMTPTRVHCNAPWPGFVEFHDDDRLSRDAYDYSPTSPTTHRHSLELRENEGLSIHGRYTGLVPPGYKRGDRFELVMTLTGQAREPTP
jgi:hypothetical protein